MPHSPLCKCDICIAEENLFNILTWLSIHGSNKIAIGHYVFTKDDASLKVDQLSVSRNGNGFTVIDWRPNEGYK